MGWTDEDRRKLYAATHNATKEREQRFAENNQQREQRQAAQQAANTADHHKRMRQIAEDGQRMQRTMNSGASPVTSDAPYQGSGVSEKKKGGVGTLLVIVAVVVGIAMMSGNEKSKGTAPSESQQPASQPQRYEFPRELVKPSPSPAPVEQAPAEGPTLQAPGETANAQASQESAQTAASAQTEAPAQVPEQTYAVQKMPVTYPKLASDYHIQGVVKLMLTIAPDGTVTAAEAEGQASPILVDAGQRAVMSWRYNPSANGVMRHKEETINYFLR